MNCKQKMKRILFALPICEHMTNHMERFIDFRYPRKEAVIWTSKLSSSKMPSAYNVDSICRPEVTPSTDFWV